MEKLRTNLFICFLILIVNTAAWSEPHYVTDSGTGSRNGSSMLNAFSWSDIQNSTNWSSNNANDNLIGPGDTVYFSGPFAIDMNSAIDKLIIRQSGTSNSERIYFDGKPPGEILATFSVTNTEWEVIISLSQNDFLTFRNMTWRSAGSGYCRVLLEGIQSTDINIHDNDIDMIVYHAIRIAGTGSGGWKIYRNKIRRDYPVGATESIYGHGVDILGGSDYEIYQNHFDNWGHADIHMLTQKYGTTNPTYGDIRNVDIYFNYFDCTLAGYCRAFGASGHYSGTVGTACPEGPDGCGILENIYIHHNYIKFKRSLSGFEADNSYLYYNVFGDMQNCCEYTTQAGCILEYPNCRTKGYLKTAQGWNITSSYGTYSNLRFFNNTWAKTAEATINMRVKHGGDLDGIYIKNNVIYDGAYASTPSDDPPGSSFAPIDRAIIGYDVNGGWDNGYEFENVEIDNNIILAPNNNNRADICWADYDNNIYRYYTNINDFENNNSTDGTWIPDGVTSKTNNYSVNPQFKSSNELWNDSPTEPMIANDAAELTGAPYNSLPMYNRLIDPDTTDWTSGLYPVVNTVAQPSGDWNIGAYAMEGGEPPINLAPIVNAGTDQSITLPSSASLNGTVTDDGLPDPPSAVTTLWTTQIGPGTVTFTNASAVDTTASFSLAGTYVLRLTADDSDLQTHDDVTITVNPHDTTPPERPTGLEIIE